METISGFFSGRNIGTNAETQEIHSGNSNDNQIFQENSQNQNQISPEILQQDSEARARVDAKNNVKEQLDTWLNRALTPQGKFAYNDNLSPYCAKLSPKENWDMLTYAVELLETKSDDIRLSWTIHSNLESLFDIKISYKGKLLEKIEILFLDILNTNLQASSFNIMERLWAFRQTILQNKSLSENFTKFKNLRLTQWESYFTHLVNFLPFCAITTNPSFSIQGVTQTNFPQLFQYLNKNTLDLHLDYFFLTPISNETCLITERSEKKKILPTEIVISDNNLLAEELKKISDLTKIAAEALQLKGVELLKSMQNNQGYLGNIMSDPETMENLMNTPEMQNLMNTPEMQKLMKDPEMQKLMKDPAALQKLMTDPRAMQNFMRNPAMQNLSQNLMNNSTAKQNLTNNPMTMGTMEEQLRLPFAVLQQTGLPEMQTVAKIFLGAKNFMKIFQSSLYNNEDFAKECESLSIEEQEQLADAFESFGKKKAEILRQLAEKRKNPSVTILDK